jgi:hypothetical protein
VHQEEGLAGECAAPRQAEVEGLRQEGPEREEAPTLGTDKVVVALESKVCWHDAVRSYWWILTPFLHNAPVLTVMHHEFLLTMPPLC